MDRVEIINSFAGIYNMIVCAEKDATDEEILSICNSQNPSGTELGWNTVIRKGKGAPVVCANDPNRLHILVSC